MSVLRKEEPLTTADIANQPRAGTGRGDVIDETNIDPADRRPPRSAAATSGAPSSTEYEDAAATADRHDTYDGDTYDGEIVNSNVNPAATAEAVDSRSQSGSARQTPNQAYPPRGESTAPQSNTAGSQATARHESPLFNEAELRDFRARWDQVQTSFVDEPRHAVEQADTLVATVVKRIAEQFAEERAKLEKQWDRGDNVSTEDLRQGFKRYRAFFDRLLAF
jgi:hypothetical protein